VQNLLAKNTCSYRCIYSLEFSDAWKALPRTSQMGWDFMDGCEVISAHAFSGMSASVLVVLSVFSLMKISHFLCWGKGLEQAWERRSVVRGGNNEFVEDEIVFVFF